MILEQVWVLIVIFIEQIISSYYSFESYEAIQETSMYQLYYNYI